MKTLKIILFTAILFFGLNLSAQQPVLSVTDAAKSGNIAFLRLALHQHFPNTDGAKDVLLAETGHFFNLRKINAEKINTAKIDLSINTDIIVNEKTAFITANINYSVSGNSNEDIWLGSTTFVVDKIKADAILEYLVNRSEKTHNVLKSKQAE